MNQFVKFSVRATAAAALLALGGTAFAATFDANIELDNTYRDGSNVAAADKVLSQGGRVELNAAGKAGANMFVAGRASFLAKKDGTVGTDDMWVQLGSASGDLKLGRFEAADLFPLAGDTLVNHAGTGVYGTNTLRGRKDGSQFHAAGTMNLGGGLALEIGVVETKAAPKGVRPVLSYSAGALNFAVALEAGQYVSGNDVSGAGATVGYNFGSFKLAANVANGKSDSKTRNSQTAFALTGTMGGLSVGAIAGTNEAAVGEEKVQTFYASYSMPLFGIKGASVTPAISSSTAKNSLAKTDLQETAFRVRFNYGF